MSNNSNTSKGSPNSGVRFYEDDDKQVVELEGEMLRKATETKLKKYWYCLLGKELYVYRSKDDLQHKGMHNLIGTFIKEEPPEEFTKDIKLYPIKLVFPPNKARVYYLLSKQDQEKWMAGIKKVIGY